MFFNLNYEIHFERFENFDRLVVFTQLTHTIFFQETGHEDQEGNEQQQQQQPPCDDEQVCFSQTFVFMTCFI